MTLIITIVDDEKSSGDYYVAMDNRHTMKELEQMISQLLWEDDEIWKIADNKNMETVSE